MRRGVYVYTREEIKEIYLYDMLSAYVLMMISIVLMFTDLSDIITRIDARYAPQLAILKNVNQLGVPLPKY